MIIFVQLFALLMSCSALQKSTEAGRDNTPLEVSSEPSEPGTLPGTDTGGSSGTGTTVEYWAGTIRGKIDIQLYEDNASGEREMLFWEGNLSRRVSLWKALCYCLLLRPTRRASLCRL